MRTAEGGFNVSLTRDAVTRGTGRRGDAGGRGDAGTRGRGGTGRDGNAAEYQTGETARLLRVPASSLQLGFANRQAEILNAPQWLIA